MTRYKVSGIFTIETEAKTPKEAKEKAQTILKLDGIQCCVLDVEEIESGLGAETK